MSHSVLYKTELKPENSINVFTGTGNREYRVSDLISNLSGETRNSIGMASQSDRFLVEPDKLDIKRHLHDHGQCQYYRISSVIRQSFFPSKTIPKI